MGTGGGGMGAGAGLGASGAMNGGMGGGFEASARGAEPGRFEGSPSGGPVRSDEVRGAEVNAAGNSEATESHGMNSSATAHTDADADRTMANGSARPDALQLASTMHSINQTAFDERRQLLKSVNMRLKSSRQELRAIQTNARDLRADARAKFQADLQQVKTSSANLKAALKGTKDADDATWTARRESLADAYQHYADAMAKLEVDARSDR